MITNYDKRAIKQYREVAHLLPLVAVMVRINYPETLVNLAEATDAHTETVKRWLQELQTIQPPPVTRLRSGWILTPKGRNLFLTVIFPQVIHILSTGKDELSTATADHPRSATADDPRSLEIYEAFAQVGIEINKRTAQLAQMEHITPSYIRAMYSDLERRSKHKETGLLIKLLEDNQPLSARTNVMDFVDHDGGWEDNEIRNQYSDWEN